MLETIRALLAKMEANSMAKVEIMTRIAQRNGIGKDLEAMIMLDNQIYAEIQAVKQILDVCEEASDEASP